MNINSVMIMFGLLNMSLFTMKPVYELQKKSGFLSKLIAKSLEIAKIGIQSYPLFK